VKACREFLTEFISKLIFFWVYTDVEQRFSGEVTSQKTALFIATSVRISDSRELASMDFEIFLAKMG
jgi:hypothetical protein